MADSERLIREYFSDQIGKRIDCPYPSKKLKISGKACLEKHMAARQVTILCVDQDYQITYWILQDKAKIVSNVSLTQAIELLKSNDFDLILSEPQKLAILKPTPESVYALEEKSREN